nr:hypothetical protein [Tanacetum cinerariifolium]
QGLGSNTPTGVPYTEDEIIAIVRGGKQRGHILGVGRVLPGQRTVIPPPSQDTHLADIDRHKKRENLLTKEVNMFKRARSFLPRLHARTPSMSLSSKKKKLLTKKPEYGGGSREMMRTAARMGRMRTIVRRCWVVLETLLGVLAPLVVFNAIMTSEHFSSLCGASYQ